MQPDHLNDDALGCCLDSLFDADVSNTLYQAIAARVVALLGLDSKAVHLDITSILSMASMLSKKTVTPAASGWSKATAAIIARNSTS